MHRIIIYHKGWKRKMGVDNNNVLNNMSEVSSHFLGLFHFLHFFSISCFFFSILGLVSGILRCTRSFPFPIFASYFTAHMQYVFLYIIHTWMQLKLAFVLWKCLTISFQICAMKFVWTNPISFGSSPLSLWCRHLHHLCVWLLQ